MVTQRKAVRCEGIPVCGNWKEASPAGAEQASPGRQLGRHGDGQQKLDSTKPRWEAWASFYGPLRVLTWLYLCLLKPFRLRVENLLERSKRKSREATEKTRHLS